MDLYQLKKINDKYTKVLLVKKSPYKSYIDRNQKSTNTEIHFNCSGSLYCYTCFKIFFFLLRKSLVPTSTIFINIHRSFTLY